MVDMYEDCTYKGLNCYNFFYFVTICMQCFKIIIAITGAYVVMPLQTMDSNVMCFRNIVRQGGKVAI